MKKKITISFLVMCILLGAFGQMPISASTTGYKFNNLSQVRHTQRAYIYGGNDGIEEYHYTFTIKNMTAKNYSLLVFQMSSGQYYIMAISDEPFTSNLDVSYYSTIIEPSVNWPDYNCPSATETHSWNSTEVDGLYCSSCSTVSQNFSLLNTISVPYIKISKDCKYTEAVAYVISLFKETKGDISQCEDYVNPFDESTATYDKTLGYLQNVKFTTGYLKVWDETLNKYVKKDDFSGKYRFQWGNISTSGFDLTTTNTYVRLYTSVGVYSKTNEYAENLCNGFPKNFINQYAASDLQLVIDINSFLAGSQNDFDKVYDATPIGTWLFKGYYRQDTVYLQIVNCDDSGNWSYGGYLKITTNKDGDIVGTPVTPDGGRDIDDGANQDIPSDEVIGVDWPDVWDDEDGNDDADDTNGISFNWSSLSDLFSDFMNFLSGLVVQVSDFPALFNKILAFLPDVIQTGITAGFVVAIVLRVLGR